MGDILNKIERPVRTGELTKKIWSHFGTGYTKLTQVRAATGFADLNTADMMIMGEWPSTGNELHGIEIKVSRSDWLNEVKNPHKNDSVKSYCDRWWLVIADENMVKPGELPEDWGMMAYQGAGRKLKVVKKAPKLEPVPKDNLFIASLLRHNDKEAIPIDVHNDVIRDITRQAAADEKIKGRALFEFVRTLTLGFGIVIKEGREYDYTKPNAPKVFSKWKAELSKTYLGSESAEGLAALMQKASKLDDVNSEVGILQRNLQELIVQGEKLPYNKDVERAIVWARWGLKSCQQITGHREDA